VRFAQSCILGRLRKQTFFSLAEANAAIAEVLERINNHVMRRLGVSRRHLFETVERAALAALPAEEYEFAEFGLRACRRITMSSSRASSIPSRTPSSVSRSYPGDRTHD